MDYTKELDLAKKAARKAGEFLMQNRNNIVIDSYKGSSANYATIQDMKSNGIIIDMIREEFPNDVIFSEESIPEGNIIEEKRVWIVDPIDGTRNFANGLEYFSISIAFYAEGNIQVGVVYAPAYNDSLYHAMRNGGAFLNNTPIEMRSPKTTLEESIVITGLAYFKGEELKNALNNYEKVLNKATDVVRFGSAALDLCQVAEGKCGAYFEAGLKAWDIAAGILILEEAGGVISDYNGKILNLFSKKEEKYFIPETLSAKSKDLQKALIDIINS